MSGDVIVHRRRATLCVTHHFFLDVMTSRFVITFLRRTLSCVIVITSSLCVIVFVRRSRTIRRTTSSYVVVVCCRHASRFTSSSRVVMRCHASSIVIVCVCRLLPDTRLTVVTMSPQRPYMAAEKS